ncbi:MAG: preprotein translocase subunit SecE [Acidobacteriia bacterium]|nr:preprotein translocase subunit SecE [Terriglobia bacterium]
MAKTAIMTREDRSLGNRIKQFPSRTKNFLVDVRNEMRKVTFPSRKEVQATTLVVIITVILFGVYFFVLDQAFTPAVAWVLKHK